MRTLVMEFLEDVTHNNGKPHIDVRLPPCLPPTFAEQQNAKLSLCVYEIRGGGEVTKQAGDIQEQCSTKFRPSLAPRYF